jgi:hypothetical protein
MTLRWELGPFATTGHEAFRIVDDLFANIIASLRRDQRFTMVRPSEFDLLLADVRHDVEQRLFDELHDRVHLDDVDYVDGVEA